MGNTGLPEMNLLPLSMKKDLSLLPESLLKLLRKRLGEGVQIPLLCAVCNKVNINDDNTNVDKCPGSIFASDLTLISLKENESLTSACASFQPLQPQA